MLSSRRWLEVGFSRANGEHYADMYPGTLHPKKLWLKPVKAHACQKLFAAELGPAQEAGVAAHAAARFALRMPQLDSLKQITSKKAASTSTTATTGLIAAKIQPDLTRYFISSLDPKEATTASMAQKIRTHWCCESRHWQRDALWGEDTCQLRNPNAACALALIRTALQALLHGAGQASLPFAFENVAHNLSLGWKLPT